MKSLKEVLIGDKVRIVDVTKIRNGEGLWENGEEVAVIGKDETKGILEVECRGYSEYIRWDEFEGIELI